MKPNDPGPAKQPNGLGDAVNRALLHAFRKEELELDRIESGLTSGLYLRSLAGLEPEHVQWVIRDYLPRGELTLLAGMGGVGKTGVALKIISMVTQGARFPNGAECEQGNVLYYTSENHWSKVVSPRLRANGADCSRVFQVVASPERRGEFDLGRDMEDLPKSLEKPDQSRIDHGCI